MNDFLNMMNSQNSNYDNAMVNIKNSIGTLNLFQQQIFQNCDDINQKALHMINFLENKIKKEFLNKKNKRNNVNIQSRLFPVQQTNCVLSEVDYAENKIAKEKFYALKAKKNRRHFQVIYMFKNKIKRMYRIDCMTRKINVNFYHFIKENHERLNLNEELLEFFKNNIRFTSKSKFREIDIKYPYFKSIYDEYLNSDRFKKLIINIKHKYDEEYLKLFFRHSKNFLNFYLRDHNDEEEYKVTETEKTFKESSLKEGNANLQDLDYHFANEGNIVKDFDLTEEEDD